MTDLFVSRVQRVTCLLLGQVMGVGVHCINTMTKNKCVVISTLTFIIKINLLIGLCQRKLYFIKFGFEIYYDSLSAA